jgi:hypothetical protein
MPFNCTRKTRGCVTPWPWPFTLKSILRQKKNYENSKNISQTKKKKKKRKKKSSQNPLKRNQNPSR